LLRLAASPAAIQRESCGFGLSAAADEAGQQRKAGDNADGLLAQFAYACHWGLILVSGTVLRLALL
jgi:hypothetical protein